MSQLEVNKVLPQSGTTLTLGESGDTITIPSGATLDASSGTLTLPNGSVTAAKLASTAVDNTNTNSTVITGQTAETSIAGGDLVLIYDDSATALRKMTRTNFVAGITGGILQVKQTLKSDTFVTTNIPNSDTDVTGFSVSITPASASNKILITVTMNMTTSGNVNAFNFKLQRGSTDIFIGDSNGSRTRGSGSGYNAVQQSNAPVLQTFSFLDSPSTTSSTTYKMVVRDQNADNCSFYLNRGNSDSDSNTFVVTASSIQAIEVASSILT
jgi:hypothetical protein